MKRFSLWFKDCGPEKFEILENSCTDMKLVDRGQFYLNDMATGARILSSHDELVFFATPEQETVLRFTFGNKIQEMV